MEARHGREGRRERERKGGEQKREGSGWEMDRGREGRGVRVGGRDGIKA